MIRNPFLHATVQYGIFARFPSSPPLLPLNPLAITFLCGKEIHFGISTNEFIYQREKSAYIEQYYFMSARDYANIWSQGIINYLEWLRYIAAFPTLFSHHIDCEWNPTCKGSFTADTGVGIIGTRRLNILGQCIMRCGGWFPASSPFLPMYVRNQGCNQFHTPAAFRSTPWP